MLFQTGIIDMVEDVNYNLAFLNKCEVLWGKGNLTPNRGVGIFHMLDRNKLKDKVLIDFGCGAGGAILQMANYSKKIIGIDINVAALGRAHYYIEQESITNVDFVVQRKSSNKIDVDDDFADVILSKDAVVHIKDKHVIFNEFHRICKPDGLIRLSDWYISSNAGGSSAIHKFLSNTGLNFSITSLGKTIDLLGKTGFVIVNCFQNHDWYRQNAEEDIIEIERKQKSIDKIIGQEGRKNGSKPGNYLFQL